MTSQKTSPNARASANPPAKKNIWANVPRLTPNFPMDTGRDAPLPRPSLHFRYWSIFIATLMMAGVILGEALGLARISPIILYGMLGVAGCLIALALYCAYFGLSWDGWVCAAIGMLLVGMAGVGLDDARVSSITERVPDLAQGTFNITADIIESEHYRGNRQRVILHPVAGLAGWHEGDHLRLVANKNIPPLTPGERIDAEIVLSPLPSRLLPNGFDFRRHAAEKNIVSGGFLRAIHHQQAQATGANFSRLRTLFQRRIFTSMENEDAAAIASALLIGFRAATPSHLHESFRGAGLAHFLAISGLHMGLICVASMLFLTIFILISHISASAGYFLNQLPNFLRDLKEVEEVPEIPEVPEVPEVLEVLEVPEVLEIPEILEISEISEIPEVSPPAPRDSLTGQPADLSKRLVQMIRVVLKWLVTRSLNWVVIPFLNRVVIPFLNWVVIPFLNWVVIRFLNWVVIRFLNRGIIPFLKWLVTRFLNWVVIPFLNRVVIPFLNWVVIPFLNRVVIRFLNWDVIPFLNRVVIRFLNRGVIPFLNWDAIPFLRRIVAPFLQRFINRPLMPLFNFIAIPQGAVNYFLPRKVAAAISIPLCFLFLLFAGVPVSALRAFLMLALVLVAVLISRRGITIHHVALAAIVVLLSDPSSLFTPAFQMSFSAVFALVVAWNTWQVYRPLTKPNLLLRLFGYAVGIAATSLIASLASMPFALYHFGVTTSWSVVANILGMPLMAFIIMPLGGIALMLAGVGLDTLPLILMEKGIIGLIVIAEYFSSLYGARIIVVPPSAFTTVCLAASLIILGIGKRYWRVSAIVPLLLGLVLWHRQPVPMAAVVVLYNKPLLAVLADDGELVTSTRRTGNFAKGILASPFGRGEVRYIRDHVAADCGDGYCLIDSERGQRVAIVWHGVGLTPSCREAHLVLSLVEAHHPCGSGTLVDKRDIDASGGMLIYPDGSQRWVMPKPQPNE